MSSRRHCPRRADDSDTRRYHGRTAITTYYYTILYRDQEFVLEDNDDDATLAADAPRIQYVDRVRSIGPSFGVLIVRKQCLDRYFYFISFHYRIIIKYPPHPPCFCSYHSKSNRTISFPRHVNEIVTDICTSYTARNNNRHALYLFECLIPPG